MPRSSFQLLGVVFMENANLCVKQCKNVVGFTEFVVFVEFVSIGRHCMCEQHSL